jgi:hypothetical protein
MSYICNICDKAFKYEYLLLRHNKRKTPCKNKKKININNTNTNTNNTNTNNTNTNNTNTNNTNNINNNTNVKDIINNTNDKDIININTKNNNLNEKEEKKRLIDEKLKKLDEKINKLVQESLDDKSTCKFCEKKLKTKAGLQRHMRMSCPEKRKLIREKYNLQKEKYTSNDDDIIHTTDISNITDIINQKINLNGSSLFDHIMNNMNTMNNMNSNIDIDILVKNKDGSTTVGKENLIYIMTILPNLINHIKNIHPMNKTSSNVDVKYICMYQDEQWHLKTVKTTFNYIK